VIVTPGSPASDCVCVSDWYKINSHTFEVLSWRASISQLASDAPVAAASALQSSMTFFWSFFTSSCRIHITRSPGSTIGLRRHTVIVSALRDQWARRSDCAPFILDSGVKLIVLERKDGVK